MINTYFEGQKQTSKKAKRGRSKEKRLGSAETRLMALAMVVNPATAGLP